MAAPKVTVRVSALPELKANPGKAIIREYKSAVLLNATAGM